LSFVFAAQSSFFIDRAFQQAEREKLKALTTRAYRFVSIQFLSDVFVRLRKKMFLTGAPKFVAIKRFSGINTWRLFVTRPTLQQLHNVLLSTIPMTMIIKMLPMPRKSTFFYSLNAQNQKTKKPMFCITTTSTLPLTKHTKQHSISNNNNRALEMADALISQSLSYAASHHTPAIATPPLAAASSTSVSSSSDANPTVVTATSPAVEYVCW
jgi:hypothetical protein